MLASSSDPLKNSEPGWAPITTGASLAMGPTSATFENVCPSTTTLIAAEVFTHWTVCHVPSSRAGPAISSLWSTEPLKPHDACPDGWYSILNSPPMVVDLPFRSRSQSGVAGALVVLRWMVMVMFELPGFRSLAVGTEA